MKQINSSAERFDLIILGGGIVGLTLAACLQNSQLQIAIIDNHATENAKNESSNEKNYALRVSAINRSSENVFQQAGIWQQITSMRVSPFKKIQVSDQTGTGKISFDRKDIA